MSPCLYSPVYKVVATWPMSRLGAVDSPSGPATAGIALSINRFSLILYVQIQEDNTVTQLMVFLNESKLAPPDCHRAKLLKLHLFVGERSGELGLPAAILCPELHCQSLAERRTH